MTIPSILLTGGTSGIGLSIAQSLAKSHKLVNITRSKPDKSVLHLFSGSLELDLRSGEQKIKEALGVELSAMIEAIEKEENENEGE